MYSMRAEEEEEEEEEEKQLGFSTKRSSRRMLGLVAEHEDASPS